VTEDRRGNEITAEHGGSFVKVEQAGLTPGRTVEYQGLVQELQVDAKGPIVVLRVWHRGELGRTAAARPRDCVVVQAPKKLRERQADRVRQEHGQKMKAEAIESQKRLVALQKERLA